MVDEPLPFGRSARALFGLDAELTFLNHGSFGAVPLELLDKAAALRRAIEGNPVAGIWRETINRVREVAERAAAFVGADPATTGFVGNATAAINAVLADFPLAPGDEILHLEHGYFAVWQTLQAVARRRGVVPIRVPLSLPVRSGDQVVDAFMRAATDRTKLIVFDQITSPTALRLPTAKLVEAAAARGIEVLIDGAHSPGMLERPAAEAPAAAWTGNLHKWPSALRGCALLFVRPDLAAHIHAPSISHHFGLGLARELDWQGTIDPTPWLLADQAIEFWRRFGGWDHVRAHNHALATAAHAHLCERLEVEPISPLDGSLLGSMATVRLPPPLQPRPHGPSAEHLQAALLERARIEVPIFDFAGDRFVRISCHVYNEADDYDRLVEALRQSITSTSTGSKHSPAKKPDATPSAAESSASKPSLETTTQAEIV
jgi:isopenicillin-N epimerase